MQPQNSNLEHRINTIRSNMSKIPSFYQNDASFIKTLNSSDNISSCDEIRIRTFYNLTQPAYSLLHLQQPHEQVLYPIALIIANKNQQNQCFSINLKLATWIESGGTRCIPIKINASDKDIEQYIQISHCAIFYQFAPLSQSYVKFIKTFMEISDKQKHYPVLFIGTPSICAIQQIKNTKIQYDFKIENNPSQIFISYDNILFKGLDFTLRPQIQNRKKINYPPIKINTKSLNQKGFQITVRMRIKSGEQIICCIEQKQRNKYFLINDPSGFDNPESIQLWHYLILNFIDISKSHRKEIDEKKVQKKLLAHNKIVHKVDKGFYKII